jgi:predicted MFS family arabinose efflux permease
MLVTLVGIALLAFAGSYEMLLVAAAVVGVGSATFHPEASRVADGLRRALRHRAIRPSRSAAIPARPSARC